MALDKALELWIFKPYALKCKKPRRMQQIYTEELVKRFVSIYIIMPLFPFSRRAADYFVTGFRLVTCNLCNTVAYLRR